MNGYDVIIIGSGAGGGTLALKLASSGKSILIIERGDYLPREKENWDPTEVFVNNRYVADDKWHDKHGKEFQPGIHYVVGGATKMFGAALFRLRKEDFGEVKHYEGVSPRWPLSYEDFESYYCQAEELYQVHGLRGEDPTEPPASKPYPFPPIAHEPRIQRLNDELLKAGYHPFHAPTAVMLNEADRAKSHCLKCSTCVGYPCLVHAKADAEVIAVRPALLHSNVTLLTNAEVIQLKTSSSGREVTEVLVNHDGKIESYQGGIVVVSAGAANSARILLLSANEKHPNGLANGSDQVGRDYMFHNSQVVVALSFEANLTHFQKTISLNDFYFRDEDFDFPLGNIQMIGKSKSPMVRADAPPLTPKFVLNGMARHAVDFWLTTEDIPAPNNRVTLDREKKIILNYTFNNQTPTKRLFQKLFIVAVKEFGHVDIMVNNAGVETRTSIINISSVHEDWPMPGNTAYCLSKGGMRMLTRTAGVELAPHKILVVGVGPGAVATPINLSTMNSPAKLQKLDSAIPLGRMAKPEEIAKVVAFLAGDGASYVTATTVFVDGGIMQSSPGL